MHVWEECTREIDLACLDLLCLTLASFALLCPSYLTLLCLLFPCFDLLSLTLPHFAPVYLVYLLSFSDLGSLPYFAFALLWPPFPCFLVLPCYQSALLTTTGSSFLLPPGPAYLLLLPPTNYYHYLQVTALPKYYYPPFAPVYLVYLLYFTLLYFALLSLLCLSLCPLPCLLYFSPHPHPLYLGPCYYYHQVNYLGYHFLLSVPLGPAYLLTTASSLLLYYCVQLTSLLPGPAYLLPAASKIFTSQLCLPHILPVRPSMSFQHPSKYYPCCPLFCPSPKSCGPLLKSSPPSPNPADTVSPRSCQCAVGFFSNIPQNNPLVALYFVHVAHSGVPG